MSSYWEKRAEYRTHMAHKNSDQILQEILAAYDKSIRDINEDIDRIFNRYAGKHGLSAEEAKKFLNETIDSQEEYLALKSKLSKIKDKTVKKRLKAKLESEAYKSRITRLEALKQNIYANTKMIADKEITKSTALYGNTVKENYYRNVFDFQQGTGFAYSFAEMSPERVKSILEYNWSGKHYSERVWQNTDVLASKLQETITSGIMSGKSSQRMAEELASLSMLGKFAAERLVRTEVAYMISASDQAAAEDRGTENRIFRATLDLVTSEICREHDGKIVPVKDSVPMKNVPPMHPFCRSFMEEIIDGYEHKVRRAIDPKTGKPIQVPANMTYHEWYNKYVEHDSQALANEHSIKNYSSDRKQYQKYISVLGTENVPESLAKFQELKYNNIDVWKSKKREYSTISKITQKDSYSDEYRNKLIDGYYDFKKEGFEFTDHALNRFFGQKNGKGKKQFSKEELLEVLHMEANYIDEEQNRWVKYYNGISVLQNPYTKEIVTIITRGTEKKGWKKL